MASHNLLLFLFPLLASLTAPVFASNSMYPFNCSDTANGCLAFLYHNNQGLQQEQIAAFYNVSLTEISPIPRGDSQDYIISVIAACKNINGTTAYFYDAPYTVQQNDTFVTVSEQIYSGQAWGVGDEETSDSQFVVTYTVQQNDTISDIANRLSSTVSGIQSMNSLLITDPNMLVAGWVLFVPVQLTLDVAPSPAPSIN
ncbi:conserved hypothetical protein [Ricinus communis]|uniref:LysM domain-containing protein n=1 Tax=Ricinus communis TaxID=3988 RepID=B9SPJ4_RICCO|nr:conserved hypothetical protein [Ricinus communis]